MVLREPQYLKTLPIAPFLWDIMSFVSNLLFIFLFTTFVLEFSLGVKITNVPGVSLKNIVILLMFFVLFVNHIRIKSSFLDKDKVLSSTVIFLLWCFFSLVTTYLLKRVPNYNIVNEIILFKNYADPFLLAFISFNIINDIKSAKFILLLLVLLLIVFNFITILGSLNVLHIARVTVDKKYGRTQGAFAEPNQYAAYVALFCPLAINFLFRNKKFIVRCLSFVAVISSFFCLLFTGSRGGGVSLFIASIYLAFLNYNNVSFFKKGVKIFVLVMFASILFMGIFFFLPETSKLGFERNFVTRLETQNLDNFSSGRLGLWENSTTYIVTNPIFGTGWRTFVYYLKCNSHNDYILLLTTIGFPGLFFFLIIFYRIYIAVKRFQVHSVENVWYYNAFLAGTLSFMISMLFVNMYNPFYFFFIFLGVILKMGTLEPLVELQNKSLTTVE